MMPYGTTCWESHFCTQRYMHRLLARQMHLDSSHKYRSYKNSFLLDKFDFYIDYIFPCKMSSEKPIDVTIQYLGSFVDGLLCFVLLDLPEFILGEPHEQAFYCYLTPNCCIPGQFGVDMELPDDLSERDPHIASLSYVPRNVDV